MIFETGTAENVSDMWPLLKLTLLTLTLLALTLLTLTLLVHEHLPSKLLVGRSEYTV